MQFRTGIAALGALGLMAIPAGAESESELETAARALVVDVERIVASEELTGWFTDVEAHRAMRSTLLESVCRAAPEARRRALQMLQRRAARAGDARQLFALRREMSDEVATARRRERERDALTRALRDTDECPYWVEVERPFRGRQTDADRPSLSLETGGLLQIRRTEGTWTFGGGGYGRLLAGYGFSTTATLLLGPEFGGGAMLKPNTEPTEFVINYFPAIPVVLRLHDVAWHYDIEAAPVALFQADDGRFSYGGRIGGGIGVKALRTRGFIPWAGFAAAYEHYVPSGGRDRAHFLRGGLRFGLMWAP
ncbi:MAG: hypothetical protein R3B13_08700 [Polyangiaceae bacterium]